MYKCCGHPHKDGSTASHFPVDARWSSCWIFTSLRCSAFFNALIAFSFSTACWMQLHAPNVWHFPRSVMSFCNSSFLRARNFCFWSLPFSLLEAPHESHMHFETLPEQATMDSWTGDGAQYKAPSFIWRKHTIAITLLQLHSYNKRKKIKWSYYLPWNTLMFCHHLCLSI